MASFDFNPTDESESVTQERKKSKRPKRWKVLLHNDDYTTMDFVVHILMKHFHKSAAESTQVMLEVHYKGAGVAGIYSREVAETKVVEVTEEAQSSEMPLQVTAEQE